MPSCLLDCSACGSAYVCRALIEFDSKIVGIVFL